MAIKPSKLFEPYSPLPCDKCGDDLLKKDDQTAIVAMVEDPPGNTVEIYCACKGACDQALKAQHPTGSTWEDLSDWANPVIYIRKQMAVMNRLQSGSDTYTDDAFKKLRLFLIRISQLALREPTADEHKRAKELGEFGML